MPPQGAKDHLSSCAGSTRAVEEIKQVVGIFDKKPSNIFGHRRNWDASENFCNNEIQITNGNIFQAIPDHFKDVGPGSPIQIRKLLD